MSQVTCTTVILGSSGRRTQVILDSVGSVEMGQVFLWKLLFVFGSDDGE